MLEVRISLGHLVSRLRCSSVLHIGPCIEVDAASQHKVSSVVFTLAFSPLTPHSALYAVLYEHWETVSAIIESSMKSMISNQTWNDTTAGLPENLQGKLTGAMVFKTLSELVVQYAKIPSFPQSRLTPRVGYSIASKPPLRGIRSSMSSLGISLNGSMSGPPASSPSLRRSWILSHPIQRLVN